METNDGDNKQATSPASSPHAGVTDKTTPDDQNMPSAVSPDITKAPANIESNTDELAVENRDLKVQDSNDTEMMSNGEPLKANNAPSSPSPSPLSSPGDKQKSPEKGMAGKAMEKPDLIEIDDEASDSAAEADASMEQIDSRFTQDPIDHELEAGSLDNMCADGTPVAVSQGVKRRGRLTRGE